MSVLGWIEGENADGSTLADLGDAARRLGEFVVALRGIDPTGEPQGNYRGHGLAKRDLQTRAAIESVGNEFDATTLHSVWEAALREPEWTGAPMWFHGDLHSGNLLARDRRLSAVIDFEGCSVGDPTSDLIAGWWLFDPASRQVFREAIGTDDASWAKGRAWALSTAVIALPYYIDTNLAFADMARRAISHVVNDR